MNNRYLANILKIGLLAALIITGLIFVTHKKGVTTKNENSPEISGWIAWWIEDAGYAMAEKYQDKIFGVSPGWLKLDKDRQLVEIGKANKKMMGGKLKSFSLKLYPMMSTDLKDSELADFIKDEKASDEFIGKVIQKLKESKADGLDVDFENIGAPYSAEFSTLIKKLGAELKKNNLGLSVTVQAQTGQNDWNGLKGQDLSLIGQVADEVRLMIYDRHGQFSKPGPITPMDWYKQVLDYNLKVIPKEKLVIGLPTYGYLWENSGNFKSFQFKDFVEYAKDKNYEVKRDPESFELNYVNSQSIGWLSDSAAVISKIEYARTLGQNRFVLWNLSGTDEQVFERSWPSP
jgi:spore germination protein